VSSPASVPLCYAYDDWSRYEAKRERERQRQRKELLARTERERQRQHKQLLAEQRQQELERRVAEMALELDERTLEQ